MAAAVHVVAPDLVESYCFARPRAQPRHPGGRSLPRVNRQHALDKVRDYVYRTKHWNAKAARTAPVYRIRKLPDSCNLTLHG